MSRFAALEESNSGNNSEKVNEIDSEAIISLYARAIKKYGELSILDDVSEVEQMRLETRLILTLFDKFAPGANKDGPKKAFEEANKKSRIDSKILDLFIDIATDILAKPNPRVNKDERAKKASSLTLDDVNYHDTLQPFVIKFLSKCQKDKLSALESKLNEEIYAKLIRWGALNIAAFNELDIARSTKKSVEESSGKASGKASGTPKAASKGLSLVNFLPPISDKLEGLVKDIQTMTAPCRCSSKLKVVIDEDLEKMKANALSYNLPCDEYNETHQWFAEEFAKLVINWEDGGKSYSADIDNSILLLPSIFMSDNWAKWLREMPHTKNILVRRCMGPYNIFAIYFKELLVPIINAFASLNHITIEYGYEYVNITLSDGYKVHISLHALTEDTKVYARTGAFHVKRDLSEKEIANSVKPDCVRYIFNGHEFEGHTVEGGETPFGENQATVLRISNFIFFLLSRLFRQTNTYMCNGGGGAAAGAGSAAKPSAGAGAAAKSSASKKGKKDKKGGYRNITKKRRVSHKTTRRYKRL